jgi:hypothetical protein
VYKKAFGGGDGYLCKDVTAHVHREIGNVFARLN